MNWLVIGNAVLYLGAALWSLEKAHYLWAFIWLCYALSAVALAMVESK